MFQEWLTLSWIIKPINLYFSQEEWDRGPIQCLGHYKGAMFLEKQDWMAVIIIISVYQGSKL